MPFSNSKKLVTCYQASSKQYDAVHISSLILIKSITPTIFILINSHKLHAKPSLTGTVDRRLAPSTHDPTGESNEDQTDCTENNAGSTNRY